MSVEDPRATGDEAETDREAYAPPFADEARRLAALVEAGKGDELARVFAHFLDREITVRTWEDLSIAAGLMGGPALVFLVSWTGQADVEDIEPGLRAQGLDGPALDLALRLAALYGRKTLSAFYMSNITSDNGDDWEYVRPVVTRDETGSVYTVTTTIVKKNGESFTVIGGSNSALRWARIMLEALSTIGDREAFDSSDVKRLQNSLEAVRTMLDRVENVTGASDINADS